MESGQDTFCHARAGGDPAAIGCPVPCAADENSEKILEGKRGRRGESEKAGGNQGIP